MDRTITEIGHVTIIAEIGINHFGDISLAKRMIDLAARYGADIAKFQWYRPIELLGENSTYLKEAERAQFTFEQHKELKKHCDSAGIEWCVSVFHADLVPLTEKLGIKRYKVASRAATDERLLAEIAKTGKPVIVSTGLLKYEDVYDVMDILRDQDVTLLHCVCDYPTSLRDVNLSRMEMLKNTGLPVGLSSHCPNMAPTLLAVANGAAVIENHVRLEECRLSGCDISSSMWFHDFGEMVKIIRSMEKVR